MSTASPLVESQYPERESDIMIDANETGELHFMNNIHLHPLTIVPPQTAS